MASSQVDSNAVHDVLIIGAGLAGIGMGIRLKKAGIGGFIILERAATVGGTWRDNVYPGVACDVESHLYSFSFEPNPNWTRAFAPQKEILAYIEHCAEKYGIRPKIQFNTAVVGVAFLETRGLWSVTTASGATMLARFLVSGSGHALTRPIYPDIPGRDSFTGKAMHSGRWDAEYRLEGKRVAVIGTGASAIQIVPAIAASVARLHVFQRTAPWIMSKADRRISKLEQKLFTAVPALQRLARMAIYWQRELLAAGFVLDTRIMKAGGWLALRQLRRCVADPALRKKLTPAYTMGCKRILPTSDYYPALARKNVELVTDLIKEIRGHEVITEDGSRRTVDALIFATGFEAAEARPAFPIRGLDGRDLAEVWKDGIEAYRGTTVSGFPNFFMLIGPNCGLGHSSMIFMMESQFNYIVDAITTLDRRKLKYFNVKREVETSYNEWLQRRLSRTVWNTGGCNSWYLTRGGKNTTAWPGFTFEYRLKMRRFDSQNYEAKS